MSSKDGIKTDRPTGRSDFLCPADISARPEAARPTGRSDFLCPADISARPEAVRRNGRLKKRSDFLRLRDSGKKWVSPTVIVQVAAPETTDIRVGFTATKKIGGAVVRNRAKRRLREAARMALKGAQMPSDIVLIGRESTATCPFAALLKDMRWCFKRLEIHGHANGHDANAKPAGQPS